MRFYKRFIFFGTAAIMIFTPIARGAVSLWAMTPVFLLIYFLLFVCFWRSAGDVSSVSVFKVTLLDGVIFSFVGLAAVSVIFSIYKHDSLYAFLRLLAYVGLYYLIVFNFDANMKRRLLGLVILLGAGLSFYGILQYIGILGHSWWHPAEFLAASYVNHNHFAGYLELVIPLAVGMLAARARGSFYLFIGLTLALCLMFLAFVFAQSRGAWMSLVVSLFVMNIVFVKRGAGKRSLVVFILIATLFLGFFYIRSGEFFPARGKATVMATPLESEPSLQSRLQMWRSSLRMAGERPLTGVGIGDFDRGFYRFRPEGFNAKAVYAHNEYLHMAAEMGVLAPFLMIVLFLLLMRPALRPGVDLATLGCSCGILSLCLHGLVDFNFHIPANMILFVIYAAFLRGGGKREMEETREKREEKDYA